MKILFIITFPLFLSSCCFMNGMFDERKVFESNKSEKIGTDINDATNYPYRYLRLMREDIDESTKRYVFGEPQRCQYAYIVDKKTNKITSWTYLANKDMCMARKFYCGAW